jgi:multiple sugar transport system permease protein
VAEWRPTGRPAAGQWNVNSGATDRAAFVLPALVNFAVFRYVPIGLALHASLYDYSLLGGFGDFVFLKNFMRALTDDLFWQSLKVSVLFALMKVPLQVVWALLLAVFLAREARGMGAIRTIIFIPVVTSLVVISMLFSMMQPRPGTHSELPGDVRPAAYRLSAARRWRCRRSSL